MHVTELEAASMYARACRAWYQVHGFARVGSLRTNQYLRKSLNRFHGAGTGGMGRGASRVSSVASPSKGDDDAIVTVELDMNLCHPDPGYFPSGL
jgi:hypothetical protein